MAITILNPTFIDNGSGGFINWTDGTAAAWQPTAGQALGIYTGGDDRIYQTGVFTDFGTGTNHRVKINVTFASGSFNVEFGTNTVATINTVGVHYITASAATNDTLTMTMLSGIIELSETSIADINITEEPASVMPVYNPIWFNLNSINYANANYKYVFNLFTGLTTSTSPINTVKLLPRPATNNCIYSPARVLESYVNYDNNIQNIISATTSLNHIIDYTVDFGEEFGPLTGITTTTGMTQFTGYTFNGVLQYAQVPAWPISLNSPRALTRQPHGGDGVYVKNSTDRGTLSYLTRDNNIRKYRVVVTHSDNSTTDTVFKYNGWSASTAPGNRVVHLPAGPWNLNNIPSSQIVSGATAGSIIDVENDLNYDIYAIDSLGADSEGRKYIIDQRCSKYQTVRVQFLNSYGSYDYANFNMVSRKSLNITRNTFKKNLAYNYVVGDREKSTLDIDGNLVYMVTSDWMSNAEAEWMQELMMSININIIDDNGVATPVNIQEGSLDVKKTINDKLFNYTFNFETSSPINGARA